MADATNTPPQDPVLQSQNRDAIIDEFNKSIGLGSNTAVDNPSNNYSPRPTAIDIYNKVVGNPIVGPNPGMKGMDQKSLMADIGAAESYKNSLTDLSNKTAFSQENPYQKMRPFSYNGDFDGANFERYYSSAPFKKLGFNPYRDNEHLYNDNMTFGDEFSRAASQWPNLVATGFMSGVRSWGTVFTDPLAPDLKGAREMQKAMAIGSSTKEGAGSFFINTALNSGYTIGIGGEMLAETLALAGATAITGGLDIEATLPLWMTRMAGAANKGKQAFETVKAMEAANSISKLKTFWNETKVGRGLAKAGGVLNPLEHTWEVGKEIVQGTNALKYTDEALGTVNRFAQWSKNFGEFAKDMTMIKAAVSEAQLEGGMVKMDATKDLIDQYRANNNGKDPEGEELAKINSIADDEAHRTAFWNLPAIMWSNKFMYETMFAPFEKTAKKGITNLAEDILFKEGKFTAVSEGVAGKIQKVKAGITSPKAWRKFGYAYLKENSAEGVQENLQEAISTGAKSHALATYNNPDRKAYEGYMGHFMTGMKQQFSAQGAETFAGGFVMGAMAHPFMGTASWIGESAWNNTFGKENHEQYKAQRKEQLDANVKTLNELYTDLPAYLAPDITNAIKQGNLSENFYEAQKDADRKAGEDIKSVSAFEHLYTALSTGKLDIVLEKFQKMKEMSPEDAAAAFKVEDGAKALSMIDDITARAENIKKNYQDVNANYPNPYDPFRYKKGSAEAMAQSIGYNAWEDAKKNFVFARTEFENHTKRIQQLADALIGKRNPIKNANAQDLLALMDKNSLGAMAGSLRMDIKTGDDSTAEGRKILNEKVKKLALIESLAEGFERVSKATLGQNLAEKKVVEQELKKNFKSYLNHIAKQSGDFVFDSQVSDALDLIKDNYMLRDERASLVRSINVLNNPKGFLGLQRGLAEAYIDIQANIPKNVAERQKAFATEAQINKAINQLFKDAGATLTPEYMTSLYESMGKDEVIESPKEYVFGEEIVTDVEDPRFKKADEVWSKISRVIETDKPVEKKAQTKEDIENEKNTKLNAIKVDVMTLNQNDPFYTKDLSWAVTTKGVDERTTIVGALPFGEDHPLSLIEEDTYSEDPKPILEEYKKKLANFKEPVVEQEKKGRLIYATMGSGKSTAVKASKGEMIDVDDLLVAEIKKFIEQSDNIKAVPSDEAAPTTIFNFAKNVTKEQKEEVYDKVRNQIKDLVAQGKTVLTGSTDFIKDADLVYTQTGKTGLSGSALENLVKRENLAIQESGKTAVPLEGFIGDKLDTGIRTGVAPSDGLIKRGIRFGFTKEQMHELTSIERAQVMSATEKADVQDLLDKYQNGVQEGKPDYDLIIATVEGLKGKHVTIHNIVEGGRVDFFLYQNKDKEYVLADYANLNAPIAKSTESEEDAIQKGFDILTGVEAEKTVTPVKSVDIQAQLSQIASVKTFAEMDKMYDKIIETMTGETVDNNEIITKALMDKEAELMKTITPENLSAAKKKGYKIVIDNKIYPTFTVNKKKGTVSVKSPLGTKSQAFPLNKVETITTMSAQPEVAVSKETKQQVKDAVKTSSEIISDADLQKANDEAKTQKNEDINDDFFNNLGCK